MKRFHAMVWVGVALVAAGVVRLVVPFSTTIGTIRTSCGNPVAYLDNQDQNAVFAATLSICKHSLELASLEGLIAVVVGLVLFLVGFVVVLRRRRRRRAPQRRRAQEQRAQERRAAESFEPSVAASDGRGGATAGATLGAASAGRAQDAANAEIYEQFMRLGRFTRPRSVLTFFAIVFAALVSGSVIAIALFLKYPSLTRYIPWILAFDGVVAIVLIIGVFVTITKDPARLMLSEIANQNAVALRAGRRRDDPPLNDTVGVRRIDADPNNPTQHRRRWNDPQE